MTAPAPYQSYQTVGRIPDSEPYVVGVNTGKLSILWGTVVAFTVVVWAVAIGWLRGLSETISVLPIIGVPAVISIASNCFIWYTAVSGGPQLAANNYGLWIRARKWPAKGLFLPWETIGRIYVRKAGLADRALCVEPRDPRVGSGMGAFAGFDQAVQRAFTGAKLTASLKFADRPEEEILAAVAQFAAGRVWLG